MTATPKAIAPTSASFQPDNGRASTCSVHNDTINTINVAVVRACATSAPWSSSLVAW